jgi:hypothetical protein
VRTFDDIDFGIVEVLIWTSKFLQRQLFVKFWSFRSIVVEWCELRTASSLLSSSRRLLQRIVIILCTFISYQTKHLLICVMILWSFERKDREENVVWCVELFAYVCLFVCVLCVLCVVGVVGVVGVWVCGCVGVLVPSLSMFMLWKAKLSSSSLTDSALKEVPKPYAKSHNESMHCQTKQMNIITKREEIEVEEIYICLKCEVRRRMNVFLKSVLWGLRGSRT